MPRFDQGPLPIENNKYGFSWGSTEVIRATEIKGHILLFVKSRTQKLTVRVTPCGAIRLENHERLDGRPLHAGRSVK